MYGHLDVKKRHFDNVKDSFLIIQSQGITWLFDGFIIGSTVACHRGNKFLLTRTQNVIRFDYGAFFCQFACGKAYWWIARLSLK